MSNPPVAILAAQAPLRTTPSSYPPLFAARMGGREKRPLGNLFGLENFGVNLTRLAPGAISALRHAHLTQDEFISEEPAGMIIMKTGNFSTAPAIGIRSLKDTISISRRRPRWVSISRRPGRYLGLFSQSKPRSIASKFMDSTIPTRSKGSLPRRARHLLVRSASPVPGAGPPVRGPYDEHHSATPAAQPRMWCDVDRTCSRSGVPTGLVTEVCPDHGR